MSFGDSGGTCTVSQCIGNLRMCIQKYTLVLLMFIVSSHCRTALLVLDTKNVMPLSCMHIIISVYQLVVISNWCNNFYNTLN